MKSGKEKSTFREYAESLVFALILALIMRQFVVQAFKIPSGSMEETLLVGDHILVNKFLYRFNDPKRFDIIVFQYPWDNERDFIKRVIALPGDRVEIMPQQISVNGQSLDDTRYTHYDSASYRYKHFGPITVPKKGDIVEIRKDNRLYLNNEPITMPTNPCGRQGLFDPLDGEWKSGFAVFYARLFPQEEKDGRKKEVTLEQPIGPITVDDDYYFTLGDHRDNSKDSRYWGFVKRDRIKGKAFFIYWSWNRQGPALEAVRWNRLGKLLQLPTL